MIIRPLTPDFGGVGRLSRYRTDPGARPAPAAPPGQEAPPPAGSPLLSPSSPAPPPGPLPTPPLALSARGLAALYAGTPVATLRRAGLAHGGSPEADAALDAAFAATPYMLDGF